MTPRQPVLVLGGTGHYGRRIVAALTAMGAPARVLSRDASRAGAIFGGTVEVVQGDLTDRASAAAALEGARAVVIAVSALNSAGARHRDALERDAVLATLEEAQRAGVTRVVYLSGYEVRRDFVEALGLTRFAGPMLDVQAALAASGLNWTVLGCAPSMEIFFAMLRGSVMTVPGGGPPALPTIAPRDVGVIAAQAALRDDLGGKRFRLTGPEALSFPAAAERIGEVFGYPIKVRAIPLVPLRVVGWLLWPIKPFVRYLSWAVTMMNNFPQDLAEEVPADHRRLLETFQYSPTTLEEEARQRLS